MIVMKMKMEQKSGGQGPKHDNRLRLVVKIGNGTFNPPKMYRSRERLTEDLMDHFGS